MGVMYEANHAYSMWSTLWRHRNLQFQFLGTGTEQKAVLYSIFEHRNDVRPREYELLGGSHKTSTRKFVEKKSVLRNSDRLTLLPVGGGRNFLP